jgi:CRISPR/Cas system-associated endonuclease Cas1
MEPLRAPVCDLLTLNLLNHRILSESDFDHDLETGGFHLRQESHKAFFTAWEQSMVRQFTAVKGAPHTTFRAVIDDAVLRLLKALEGDAEYDFFQMP